MPDTAAPLVLVEDLEGVRTLTLNRPDKRNALNTPLTEAILDAFLAAEADDSVRAIVVAGAGQGFCAGADLTEFDHLTPNNAGAVAARAELTTRTQRIARSISTPVVAAVHGAAVGGGAGLALGADMLIVADDVKLGFPELKHSIVPAIVMAGLREHFGTKVAFDLVGTGRFVQAPELLERGVANDVTSLEDLLPTAHQVAATLASAKPESMAAAKKLFYRVGDLPFDEALEAGRDVNEQMRAFREGSR